MWFMRVIFNTYEHASSAKYSNNKICFLRNLLTIYISQVYSENAVPSVFIYSLTLVDMPLSMC